MRVLVAPQEYKGTLTAVEAADAIAAAVRGAFPDAEVDVAPMADGGPGTAAALLAASGGVMRRDEAHDPLMRLIEAEWALLPGGTAVIECASASGLLRLRPEELDPRRASSYGTGELIAAAMDAGCRELILGIGGSATNDGGAGMAQALGYRLLDSEGEELPPGGAALARLARIDATAARPGLRALRVVAATDVSNPLCGPEGASAVYGPQKGADAAAVAELDAALRHFAAIVRRDLGADVLDVPGAGAAGGLGAGAIAFLRAALRSGAEVVGEAAGLPGRVLAADVVLTGEGRLDGQTPFGKAPAYVARLARTAGRPVACLPGSVGPGHEAALPLFDVVEVGTEGFGVSGSPRDLLAAAAIRALRRLGAGR
ncbi:MAG TPA: glycerate kinase [Dehalococcoidia bacterium]|nr:glycerate kinase [Dehalococcoidia bacterium]